MKWKLCRKLWIREIVKIHPISGAYFGRSQNHEHCAGYSCPSVFKYYPGGCLNQGRTRLLPIYFVGDWPCRICHTAQVVHTVNLTVWHAPSRNNWSPIFPGFLGFFTLFRMFIRASQRFFPRFTNEMKNIPLSLVVLAIFFAGFLDTY